MTYPKIDKPTVPGWYWATSKGEQQVVRVWRVADEWFVGKNMSDNRKQVSDFTSWFGPLPEPTE